MVDSADIEGVRTFLTVPLISGEKAIGTVNLYHRLVKPFTCDQIELAKSFANHVVIAIENIRQFRELKTRLEREAAKKEILHVVSQNRDDDIPVFNAILERAMRLCRAQASGLQLVNDARTT